MRFVATTEERFDVIISDSTDPIGPGEVLFSENFYQACRRCLNEGGILVREHGAQIDFKCIVCHVSDDGMGIVAKRIAQFFQWTVVGADVEGDRIDHRRWRGA